MEEQQDKAQNGVQSSQNVANFFWIIRHWGKYLVPVSLLLISSFVLLTLFIGTVASNDGCYAADDTQTGGSSGIGGDWKDEKSETHKAMQYAADQFKDDLHMSGDNISAALAIGLRESGFNPNAVNTSGSVKGIWQWGTGGINGNRYGMTADTVESQVALAITELRTTHMATLTHMHNASLETSLDAWDVYLEGVGIDDPQRKVAKTLATAREIKTAFSLDFAGDLIDTGSDGDIALDGDNSNSNDCASTSGTASGLPIKGSYNITGGYPEYSGATGGGHYGVDFQTVGAQENGEASNVYSVSDGVVVSKTNSATGGNAVVIKNDDGTYAYYGHAPSLDAIVVSQGQKVKKGQHISHQGQTGLATGVHVHFGVNTKQSSFGIGADGLISPGDYLTALPKQAISGKGLVVPAGPFTTDESDDNPVINQN